MVTKQDLIDMGYTEDDTWMKPALRAIKSQHWNIKHEMYWPNVKALAAFFHDGGDLLIEMYNIDDFDNVGD